MSSHRLLVLGDTGLAGSAILAAARRRGLTALGASRRGETTVDIRYAAGLRSAMEAFQPTVIVNAAALVSVQACEEDPGEAWLVNARPAALVADYARGAKAHVAHISTDHFYSGDGRRPHLESDPVMLLNDYARTKYAAEGLALTHADTLVVRTNILGLKSATGGSFGEWALKVIEDDQPATLFDDQFVSILDIWAFAEGLLDLVAAEATGVVNLASSQVFSKAELVQALAGALGRTLTRARTGSVSQLDVRRPDSLGLDVSRAESLLGRQLPTLTQVAQAYAARAQQTGTVRHALGS